MRPSAIALFRCSRAFSATDAIIAVSIAPGATAFTRILRRAHSRARRAPAPARPPWRRRNWTGRETRAWRPGSHADDRAAVAHDLQAILAAVEDTGQVDVDHGTATLPASSWRSNGRGECRRCSPECRSRPTRCATRSIIACTAAAIAHVGGSDDRTAGAVAIKRVRQAPARLPASCRRASRGG